MTVASRSVEVEVTVTLPGSSAASISQLAQCRRQPSSSRRCSLVPRPRGRREDVFSPPTRPGNEATEDMDSGLHSGLEVIRRYSNKHYLNI